MEFYRRFDLVIGTRFHGCMLAIQAGVPSICIPHDSRTLELCQSTKIPYINAREVVTKGLDINQLLDLPNFNPTEFDSNRKEMASRYNSFCNANNLPSSVSLEA